MLPIQSLEVVSVFMVKFPVDSGGQVIIGEVEDSSCSDVISVEGDYWFQRRVQIEDSFRRHVRVGGELGKMLLCLTRVPRYLLFLNTRDVSVSSVKGLRMGF
ncbi:hypothetical protein BRARA_B02850 [Brassica rapa]|uniref:Uncharacterized protein n=1 Tax=Brassica campestris TaxID=3711 RepID=A0A398ADF7_BRACM|nr:hypothetical protein BRARA_B02850 [Brassica rapa]